MYQVRVSIDNARPNLISVRAWRAVLRSTMEATGLYWWRTYARRHFTAEAQTRYSYQPRTQQYLDSKTKRGKPPMCLTFETYRAVVSTTPMVRGFPTRARVSFATPAYVRMRPMAANKPNLGAELTRVTWDETTDVGRFAKQESIKGILKARFEAARKEIV